MKLVGYELVSSGVMYRHLGDIESGAYRILLILLICDANQWPRGHATYPVGVPEYTPTGYHVFDGNTLPR